VGGVIKEENYSIQAKNLFDFLIRDYLESLKSFHQDNFYLHEIKKFRFNINNRIRKLLDIAEVKNNFKENFYNIIVFNTEYNELIKTELNLIPLSYKEEGQNIFVNKKKLTFNQLMRIIDDIEGFKNKTLTKCSKAKLEPILRAKNALENDFIDQIISRETSNKCQELYESTEKEIVKITENKIKFVLGSENYEKYLKEKI
tara:strand:+ start:341 stop:943 length:603 start_codon:yes stop_codon:yes gene_type:complete